MEQFKKKNKRQHKKPKIQGSSLRDCSESFDVKVG